MSSTMGSSQLNRLYTKPLVILIKDCYNNYSKERVSNKTEGGENHGTNR